MGRYTVAHEGRATLDGRMIELGALSAHEDRIPVLEEFNSDVTIGWAEDFGRDLNGDISFEIYFKEGWEDKVRTEKLTPTCTIVGPKTATPYDNLDAATAGLRVVTNAKVVSVQFSIGPNAWGEYPA